LGFPSHSFARTIFSYKKRANLSPHAPATKAAHPALARQVT
jgi:hypothetical protein